MDQGLPYWERFLAELPDVEALANAPEAQVKGLWSGLGYYRRADLLHRGAKHIAAKGWPVGRDAWLAVPGVGPYTAGALASIVDGEAVPALDGNAYRVYSRLSDWSDPIDSASSRAFIEAFAQNLVPAGRPGDFNQAVMDLAAHVCTPRKPRCGECPIAEYCAARAAGSAAERPVKIRKTKVVAVDMHFSVVQRGDQFGVVQRPKGGIWSGLYSLPELAEAPETGTPDVVAHRLSHRAITAYMHRNSAPVTEPERWFTVREWKAHGMPQVFVHWLSKFVYI